MKEKKTDESLYVYQRDKLKENLDIREFKWTKKQKEFIDIALDKNTKVIFVSGPAGTSKTLLAVYCGLKLLDQKRVSELIYIRSAVESSSFKIGFLPGEVSDKFYFYNLPFTDKLEELLPKHQVKALEKEKRVFSYPPNYARGMSWNAKCFIYDECQNSGHNEIVTILTRFGHFSKCFILADPKQTDLNNGSRGGFNNLYNHFNNYPLAKENGIYCFKFETEDIVRSDFLKFLVEALEVMRP